MDFSDTYYLGVRIGNDDEAVPRMSFSENPYAFTARSVHADSEDALIETENFGNIVLNSAGNIQLSANDTTSAFIVNQQGAGNLFALERNGTTSFIVQNNGYVGIGTGMPSASLDVGGGVADFIDGDGDVLVAGDLEVDGTIYGNIANAIPAAIFDGDGDTGVQAEANSDEDFIRMQTAGNERFRIDNQGNMKLSSNWSSDMAALFEIGNGSEPATFAVSGDAAYLNIATFRDKYGENIFRAKGALGEDDLAVTFGDADWAYSHGSMIFNSGSGSGSLELFNSGLFFYETTGSMSNYVGFRSPDSISDNQVWTLPAEDGAIDQALFTDGSGNLHWDDIINATNIGGGLSWNSSTDKINLGGNISSNTAIGFGNWDFRIGNASNYHLYNSSNFTTYMSSGSNFTNVLQSPSLYSIQGSPASFSGLTYDVDYSANYTNRSLVDKGYVDSHTSASLWQQVAHSISTNNLSPTNSAINLLSMENNTGGQLTMNLLTNRNDASNYAGAVFSVKGSGPDYTNNMYFGKYSDNYYVSSWRGNGVMATDQDMIITSAGTSDSANPNADPQIIFQVGGGYAAPVNRAIINDKGFFLRNTASVPTAVSGQSGLYSSGGELFAIDALGNTTQISPHDEETNEWYYNSKNVKTGASLRVDMERLVKKLDLLLGGGYVFVNDEKYSDENGADEDVIQSEPAGNQNNFITKEEYESLLARIKRLENDAADIQGDQESNENNDQEAESSGEIATKIVDEVRNIFEEVVFKKKTKFYEAVTFVEKAVFTDKVVFAKRVSYADKDVAGHAMIESGKKKVEVDFSDSFESLPYVTAVSNNAFVVFRIADVSKSGFSIEIEDDAEKDIEFTWQTTAVSK